MAINKAETTNGSNSKAWQALMVEAKEAGIKPEQVREWIKTVKEAL